MRITSNDIIEMVTHCVRLLTEAITVDSAYQKFYDGKIQPDVYESLVSGSENITPFHKLILDAYVKGIADDKIMKSAGDLWRESSEKARQYLIFSAKEDGEEFIKDKITLVRSLSSIKNMNGHSEAEFAERGYEVLYEDQNVLITCTKSYSSSHKYYGDSHWCTASGTDGRENGRDHFNGYSTNGLLVQFIDKENRQNNSYQVQYYKGYGAQSFYPASICNWYDKGVSIEDIKNLLREKGLNYNEIYEEYIEPHLERAVGETYKNMESENEYYERQVRIKYNKLVKQTLATFKSPQFFEKVSECVKRMLSSHSRSFQPEDREFELSLSDGFGDDKGVGNHFIQLSYIGKTDKDKEMIDYIFDDMWYDMQNYFSMVLIVDKKFNIIGKHQGFVNPDYEKVDNIGFIDMSVELRKLVDMRTGKLLFQGDNIYDYSVIDANGRKFVELELRESDGEHTKIYFDTVTCEQSR